MAEGSSPASNRLEAAEAAMAALAFDELQGVDDALRDRFGRSQREADRAV